LNTNKKSYLANIEKERTEKRLRFSWTAKKTNEWILNKAGVRKKLLKIVETDKLAAQLQQTAGHKCYEKVANMLRGYYKEVSNKLQTSYEKATGKLLPWNLSCIHW